MVKRKLNRTQLRKLVENKVRTELLEEISSAEKKAQMDADWEDYDKSSIKNKYQAESFLRF